MTFHDFIINKASCINFAKTSNNKEKLSPWWEKKQELIIGTLEKTNNIRSFIKSIQKNEISGFDHRIPLTNDDSLKCIKVKLNLLEREKDFHKILKNSEESSLSSSVSTIKYKNRNVSNIFLTHVSHYISLKKLNLKFKTIIELGCGYGSLAKIILENEKNLDRYYIVDLNHSLVCTFMFLKYHFPLTSISFYNGKISNDKIVLIPVSSFFKFKDFKNVDLFINTGSFQEMEKECVDNYCKFIFNKIKPTIFYSHNYFLNPINLGKDNERNQKSKPLVPVCFNDDYRIYNFIFNKTCNDIDASTRNWLEIIYFNKKTLNTPLNLLNKSLIYIFKEKNSFFFDKLNFLLLTLFQFGFLSFNKRKSNILGLTDFYPKTIKNLNRNAFNNYLKQYPEFQKISKLKKQSFYKTAFFVIGFLYLIKNKFFAESRTRRENLPCINTKYYKKL